MYPSSMCHHLPSWSHADFINLVPFYQNQAPQVPNPWPVAYMYPQGSFGNEFSVLTYVPPFHTHTSNLTLDLIEIFSKRWMKALFSLQQPLLPLSYPPLLGRPV